LCPLPIAEPERLPHLNSIQRAIDPDRAKTTPVQIIEALPPVLLRVGTGSPATLPVARRTRFGEGCDFGSDIDSGSGVIDFFTGQRFARVDSLAVNLGQDLYGMLVSIKADVAGLSAQVNATRQGVTVGNLTAEQENAQLLGILNEIRSLLSALQTAPSAPRALKTDPANRPASPRSPPRIIQQQ